MNHRLEFVLIRCLSTPIRPDLEAAQALSVLKRSVGFVSRVPFSTDFLGKPQSFWTRSRVGFSPSSARRVRRRFPFTSTIDERVASGQSTVWNSETHAKGCSQTDLSRSSSVNCEAPSTAPGRALHSSFQDLYGDSAMVGDPNKFAFVGPIPHSSGTARLAWKRGFFIR